MSVDLFIGLIFMNFLMFSVHGAGGLLVALESDLVLSFVCVEGFVCFYCIFA